MAMLECTNGHSVGDPRAACCPDCGASVRRSAGPGSGGSATRLSEPMALVLGGVLLGLVAGLLLAASGGGGLGLLLGWMVGVAASTLWLVGCIAMGVRVGTQQD
jgi:hypothetical protein